MKLSAWDPDLKTVVDRINDGDIDLQPDFQRQEIWSIKKKKRLIDTVLRQWSIPPVFLVVTDDERLEVLDGQQRLAAIRDFVRNDISIDGNITPIDDFVHSLHGLHYSSLKPPQKRLFDQYALRCFKITDYSPEEPSELFYRLNQPSMLTAGEQRNAFYGPAREQLKDLVEQFQAFNNATDTIGFSNVRLAYDDVLARVLFFVESKTFATKGTEAAISQRFRTADKFSPAVIETVERSIKLFSAARDGALAIKLNKASALSWLLFYCRFKKTSPEVSFMTTFTMSPMSVGRKADIQEAIKLFKDRASLRVADVASVVYRDFSLWYAYYFLDYQELPDDVDRNALISVRDILRKQDDITFERCLRDTLDLFVWGRLS